jgi:uncharacterized protein (DUF1800 family)
MRKAQNWTFTGLIFAVAGIATGILFLLPAFLHAAGPTTAPTTQPSVIVASQAPWTRDDAAHLLRRAGFGGTPEQIDKLQAMGREAAVDYLLTAQTPAGTQPVFAKMDLPEFAPTPVTPPDADTINALAQQQAARKAAKLAAQSPQTQPTQSASTPTTAPAAATPTVLTKQQLSQLARKNDRGDLQNLRAWWVDRMIRTDRPLEEKMTLLWHGLFTSGEKEVRIAPFMEQEIALYHRESLGNYKQLTNDVVHSPAMLVYLNNDKNIAGNPNENLARELMELFTMGEGKGYTEADIKEVARALTGLAPAGRKQAEQANDTTVTLRPKQHDSGMKTIFGQTGNFGPDDVVTLIFSRPEPSRHLALKLWQFYAYPDPTDADLAPVVAALEQSNYELKPALRAIFTSAAFYGDKAKFALIKSPAELMVEEVRELGVTPSGQQDAFIQQRLKAMDQELLQPPNVRGWVGGDNWITAATLYSRYNTCTAVVNGALPGGGKNRKKQALIDSTLDSVQGAGAVTPSKLFPSLGGAPTPDQVVDAAIDRFLQRPLATEKRDALLEVVGHEPLHLGQEPSDTRIRQMICLLLSTPEYQVH